MRPTDETYLLIELDSRPFALPMAAAAEILPLPALERQAPWPAVLAGFMTLRGRALPVIDLAAVLDPQGPRKAPDLYAHIVRLEAADGGALGLLVDRVVGAQMRADEFSPTGPEDSPNGAALGHLRFGDRQAPLLAPERLLLMEEAARLADIAETLEARRRAAAENLP